MKHWQTTLRGLLIVFALLIASRTVPAFAAEQVSVRDISDKREKWDQWIREKTVVTISGRYEGRAAKQFHLARLKALITPSRTTILPLDIEAGQRLTISGTFRKSGTRYLIDATRIAAGATDYERINAYAERLDKTKPQLTYELADKYEPIAKFYEDERLQARVDSLRTEAFALERTLAKGDSDALLKLAEKGENTGVSVSLVKAIRFEALAALSQSKPLDRPKLIAAIKRHLNGWDEPNVAFLPAVEAAFLKSPVASYEAADDATRTQMHRRFYRKYQLAEYLAALKPDGSNGAELADVVRTDLPEAMIQIKRLETVYVDYRLKSVSVLSRRQLEDLESLLKSVNRSAEFPSVLDKWLAAQEARLNSKELDGMLAMADEYQYAFERWKNRKHGDASVENLKRAWVITEKAAPKAAADIATRLGQLGWTRMHDRWLTDSEIKNLPKNDVELAMKEGRIVAGMNRTHVVGTLGEPTRRIRVVSAQHVQEIWVFGESGSTPFTVHLQRRRLEKPDEAIVIRVSDANN